MDIAIFKMDKYVVYSTWNSAQGQWQLGWKGSLGEKGCSVCVCVAESLCCAPETITTLLISSTPVQNKKV